MRILLQAELAELERLTGWVTALCEELQISRRTTHSIDLCLIELVTNIMSYAYPDGEKRGSIEICVSRDGDQIAMQIKDQGIPFDPSTYALPERPKSLADAAVGGQGLRLVRQFSDDISYRRHDKTNHVSLIFRMTDT